MNNLTRWFGNQLTDSLSQLSAGIAMVTALLMVTLFMVVRIDRQAVDQIPDVMFLWIGFGVILVIVDFLLSLRLKHFVDSERPGEETCY